MSAEDQERRRLRKEKRKRTKKQRKAEYKRRCQTRLKRIAELRKIWAETPPQPGDMLDEHAACLLIGGTKPIDPSTLRRRYSRPIKIGLQGVRWPFENLQADRERMNSTNSEAIPAE